MNLEHIISEMKTSLNNILSDLEVYSEDKKGSEQLQTKVKTSTKNWFKLDQPTKITA